MSNFCHRESKSEFADVRRYFRTKDLDVKIRRKKQKSRDAVTSYTLPFIHSVYKVSCSCRLQVAERSRVFSVSDAAVKSLRS